MSDFFRNSIRCEQIPSQFLNYRQRQLQYWHQVKALIQDGDSSLRPQVKKVLDAGQYTNRAVMARVLAWREEKGY